MSTNRPYRKRTTRRYKKRRMMKRKFRRNKYSKPDGNHNAKIVQRLNLTVNNLPGLTNAATYSFAWQQPESSLQPATFWNSTASCSFDWHTQTNSNSVEWIKCISLFNQYKISGFKIRYEPQTFQSAGDKSQQPITVFSTMRGSAYDVTTIGLER